MKSLMFLLILVLLLALPVAANAQTAGQGTGAPAGCTGLSAEEGSAYVALLGGTPPGAEILGVYICRGFGTYPLGDATELFDRTCQEVNIYKVSDQATQDLWQSDARVCNGNVVAIVGGGTGHYIVYGYPDEETEEQAPPLINPISVGTA